MVLVPAELARRIDWSSLRYDDTTFVDDELRDRYADLDRLPLDVLRARSISLLIESARIPQLD